MAKTYAFMLVSDNTKPLQGGETIHETFDVDDITKERSAVFQNHCVDITDVTPRPQVGWIYNINGTFSQPPSPPFNTAAHVQSLLLSGVHLTCTGTPSLNGVYAIDPIAQAKVMAIALYIKINDKFPANQSTLAYPDVSGTTHTFPSTDKFLAFATALADYAAGVDLEALKETPSWPSPNATIA